MTEAEIKAKVPGLLPETIKMLADLPGDEPAIVPGDKAPHVCLLKGEDTIVALMAKHGMKMAQHVQSNACWLEKDGKRTGLMVSWASRYRMTKDGLLSDVGGAFPVSYDVLSRHGMLKYQTLLRKQFEKEKAEKEAKALKAQKAPEPAAAPVTPVQAVAKRRAWFDEVVLGGKKGIVAVFDDEDAFEAVKSVLNGLGAPYAAPKEGMRKELIGTNGEKEREEPECFYCGKALRRRSGTKPWRYACKEGPCADKLTLDTKTARELKKAGLSVE